MAHAPDPNFAARVRDSFHRQPAMALFGAILAEVSAGVCEIHLPSRGDLTQQHGYIHGGIVGAIADSAGGYAAYSLMPAGSSVLSVEYKLNFLAPAAGERLIARGEVVKSGRSLTVTRADVYAEQAGKRTLCAVMQQTLITLHDRPDA
jgi:uncharacterized protein (TIGR00369 family)